MMVGFAFLRISVLEKEVTPASKDMKMFAIRKGREHYSYSREGSIKFRRLYPGTP